MFVSSAPVCLWASCSRTVLWCCRTLSATGKCLMLVVAALVGWSVQGFVIMEGLYLNLLKGLWIILSKTSVSKNPWEWRKIKRSLEVLWDDNRSGTHELCVYFLVLKAMLFIKHLFLSYLLTESKFFEASYLELTL